MKFGINSEFASKLFSTEEEIRFIAKAGFDCIDYGEPFYLTEKDSPFLKENFREYVQNIRDIADDSGISFHQIHAPMFGSLGEDESELKFEILYRSFEIAKILGASHNIVHPRMSKDAINGRRAKYLKEQNLKFYSSLLPYAKAAGVNIALENMFGYDSHNNHYCDTTLSSPEEILDYLECLNDERFVVCADTGHFHLLGLNVGDCLRKLGANVKCLHLHDNFGRLDQHLTPGVGTIDWIDLKTALKEINYSGVLSVELNVAIFCKNDETLPSIMKFTYDATTNLFKEF